MTTTWENNEQAVMEKSMEMVAVNRKKALPHAAIVGALLHQEELICREVLTLEADFNPFKDSTKTDLTLYLTLEPAPNLLDKLWNSNISKVILSVKDPSLKESGLRWLKEKGVLIKWGVLGEAMEKLYFPYFFTRLQGRPYTVIKVAESLDGAINAGPNLKTGISCKESLEWSHKMRTKVDAILIGAQTLRVDNPRLTPYLVKGEHLSPNVIVVSKGGELPLDSHVFKASPDRTCFVISPKRNGLPDHVMHIPLKKTEEKGIGSVIRAVHQLGFHSLLVEGGAEILNQWLESGDWECLKVITSQRALPKGLKWRKTSHQSNWENRIEIDRLSAIGEDTLRVYHQKNGKNKEN